MGGHTYNELSLIFAKFAGLLYSAFGAFGPFVIAIATLYLIVLGIKIAGADNPQGNLKKAWHIFLIMPIISWLVFWESGYFITDWLIPTFANAPLNLSIAIMSIGVKGGMTINGIDAGFAALFQAIDALGQAADEVSGYWLTFKTYMAVTALATVFGLVYAIFFATQVLSMATIYIFLALSPIFLICLIYPASRGFGMAWLRELIKYGMMAPLAGTTMGLTIVTITDNLFLLRDKVLANPESLDVFDGSFAASLFMAFITIALLRAVPDWAASLTGGTQSDNAAYSTSLNTKAMGDRMKDSSKSLKDIKRGINKLRGRGNEE